MLRIFYSIILIYLLVIVIQYFFQKNLIYFPDKTPMTPSQAGVPSLHEIQLLTTDGLTLKAWYKKAESHRPTLVYFHGNAGHLGYRAPAIRPYLEQGYGVLLLSYRGYGGSEGQPSERGFYEDARAALGFLLAERISSSCLILYGESLGTAVAVQMAVEFDVGVVILQAPFTRLADIGQYHYFYLPVRALLRESYDSMSKITQIHKPLLILQGTRDQIIPARFSQALFEAANTPKKYIKLEGYHHNDTDPTALFNYVNDFVETTIDKISGQGCKARRSKPDESSRNLENN